MAAYDCMAGILALMVQIAVERSGQGRNRAPQHRDNGCLPIVSHLLLDLAKCWSSGMCVFGRCVYAL